MNKKFAVSNYLSEEGRWAAVAAQYYTHEERAQMGVLEPRDARLSVAGYPCPRTVNSVSPIGVALGFDHPWKGASYPAPSVREVADFIVRQSGLVWPQTWAVHADVAVFMEAWDRGQIDDLASALGLES